MDKNSKIIGFPRTNNWDWMRDSQRKYYNQKVRNEIINMEDPNIPDYIKDEIETIVNFKEQPAKVHIDLKFNKSLSEDRNKILSTEKGKKLFKNVLLFYTDSISRADYRRKLPNLHKWIDQYFRGVSNSTSHEAFQFFKYHGVGRYTLLNNLPSFWGTYSLQTKYGKYYIENFKKSGYVTGTAQNHCARETVPSDDIMEISFSGFDHELNGLYCDPNNESVNNTISQFHGANSMTPRCLYGKHTGEYGIEYTLQFWEKYKKNNKFFYLGFMDNHEATAEGISLLDYKFVDFLNEFKNRGFLQDTTIIFQSDHGHAYLSLYNIVKSQDHEKELVLPLLFYLIPRNYLNEEIRENLIWNEGSIISPFTVYNSYQAIIGYEKVQIAKHSKYNVFYDKIPRSDGCNQFYDKDYFKIAEYLCRCEGDTTGN